MIGRLLLAAAMLGGAGQTPPIADIPMPPSGPWVADFEDNICVLSRAYGTDETSVTLGFHPLPGDDHIEIALVFPHARSHDYRIGSATLALNPGGEEAKASYSDYVTEGHKRVVRFSVKLDEIAGLTSADSMRLTIGKQEQFVDLISGDSARRTIDKQEQFVFKLGNTAAAMKIIDGCLDDLVKDWGFDPVALRSIAEKPVPIASPQTWITSSDYPSAALRANIGGIVAFWLRIDTTGKPVDCRILQRGGAPILNESTCQLLLKRAHFRPAKGADGKPMVSLWSSRVHWSMP